MATDLAAPPGTVPPIPRDPDPGPPGTDPAAAVARASDRGARIVVVVIAMAWHLTIGLPAVDTLRGQLAEPGLVLGAWTLVAVTGLVSGVCLLRGSPLPAWPLAALLLLVDATVFAAVGRECLFTNGNWVWGTLVWFFVLVLWGRRVVELLALLATHALIALVALLAYDVTAPADLARYAMYVYGVSSLPLAIFAGGAAIAALARQRAATAAAAYALVAEREAAERARRERRNRLALAGAAAGEILAELADGRADPTDVDVQRRCVLAAARLRRLIAESDDVPDPLLHELRAAADLAERNGLPIDLVTIGAPPPLSVQTRRRLADPLTATLAGAQGWARLTVVAEPDEVVVSLVTPASGRGGPPVTGEATVDGDGVEYLDEQDGEIRWTQTRWRR